jgi:flagellar biosynthesis/type III secretory pathway chaperone
MKAKVLITFSDGEKIRSKGKVIELSTEKFKQINKKNENILEEIKESKKPKD